MEVEARKVGGTVQAALSRVADVMAVADKATADPTNADAEGFARGEALSFPSKVLFACAPTATGAALLATSL